MVLPSMIVLKSTYGFCCSSLRLRTRSRNFRVFEQLGFKKIQQMENKNLSGVHLYINPLINVPLQFCQGSYRFDPRQVAFLQWGLLRLDFWQVTLLDRGPLRLDLRQVVLLRWGPLRLDLKWVVLVRWGPLGLDLRWVVLVLVEGR